MELLPSPHTHTFQSITTALKMQHRYFDILENKKTNKNKEPKYTEMQMAVDRLLTGSKRATTQHG